MEVTVSAPSYFGFRDKAQLQFLTVDSSKKSYLNFERSIPHDDDSTSELSTTDIGKRLGNVNYKHVEIRCLYGCALAVVVILIITLSVIAVISLKETYERIRHLNEIGTKATLFLQATEPILGPLSKKNLTLDSVIDRFLFESSRFLEEAINDLVSKAEVTLKGVDLWFDITRLLDKSCKSACSKLNNSYDVLVNGVPMRARLTVADPIRKPVLILHLTCSNNKGTFVEWPLKMDLGLSILKYLDNKPAVYKIVPSTNFLNCDSPDSLGQKHYRWEVLMQTVSEAILDNTVRYRVELLHPLSK